MMMNFSLECVMEARNLKIVAANQSKMCGLFVFSFLFQIDYSRAGTYKCASPELAVSQVVELIVVRKY